MLQLRTHNSHTQKFDFSRNGARRRTCVIIKTRQIACTGLIASRDTVNKRKYIWHVKSWINSAYFGTTRVPIAVLLTHIIVGDNVLYY